MNFRLVWRFNMDGFKKDKSTSIVFRTYSEKFEICSHSLDLTPLIEFIIENNSPIDSSILSNENSKFLTLGSEIIQDGSEYRKVKLHVSAEILTEEYFVLHPAGLGRSSPNMNPHLKTPKSNMPFDLTVA